MNKSIIFTCALFVMIVGALSGCGTGGSSGGGKDPLQAALVTIDVDPAAIKLGDRALVTVEMQNIDPNGVFLKLRYTHSLSYIEGTSGLTVAEEYVEVDPVEGPLANPNFNYMTFYIPAESFGEEDYGKLTIQLRAIEIADVSTVQVDVDLHDPEKDPSEEFDSEAPLFGVEDSAEVEINRD